MEATEESTTYVRHRGDKRRHADLGKPAPTARRRGVRHGADRRPFARFTSKTRTGTTAHFSAWMQDLRIGSTLRLLKTIDLAESHPDAKTASAYACVFGAGIKTVWDLVHKQESDLLQIKGIGPAAVGRLSDDLKKHNVQVSF